MVLNSHPEMEQVSSIENIHFQKQFEKSTPQHAFIDVDIISSEVGNNRNVYNSSDQVVYFNSQNVENGSSGFIENVSFI